MSVGDIPENGRVAGSICIDKKDYRKNMDESKEKLVSIVVPVYNVEKYLREAVESVREQTYGNWELILVENGSTDSSLEICLECEAMDQRVRTVREREKGLSNARNRGMQEAAGSYLMFLDSDDYLGSREIIEKFVDEIEKTEADIVVCNYARLWNGKILPAMDCRKLKGIQQKSPEFRFQGFFSAGMLSYVWGKMYRRDFLKRHEAGFEDYVYAEDKMFSMQCYASGARYGFIGETGYIYRKNDASVSFCYRPDSIKCWLKIAHDLQNFLDQQNKPEYKDLVRYTIFFATFFDAKMEYVRHGRSLKAVRRTLKIYGKDQLADQSFSALAFEKDLERLRQRLWKIMIRGFSMAMRLHFYLALAAGIKLLIDWRIDERLSDTGLRE